MMDSLWLEMVLNFLVTGLTVAIVLLVDRRYQSGFEDYSLLSREKERLRYLFGKFKSEQDKDKEICYLCKSKIPAYRAEMIDALKSGGLNRADALAEAWYQQRDATGRAAWEVPTPSYMTPERRASIPTHILRQYHKLYEERVKP